MFTKSRFKINSRFTESRFSTDLRTLLPSVYWFIGIDTENDLLLVGNGSITVNEDRLEVTA
jgi:hypothetical protein